MLWHSGAMNWAVMRGWQCEICGEAAWYLSWGLAHGQCVCTKCGCVYSMTKEPAVPWPCIKKEFMPAAKALWAKHKRDLASFDPRTWDRWRDKLREAKDARTVC